MRNSVVSSALSAVMLETIHKLLASAIAAEAAAAAADAAAAVYHNLAFAYEQVGRLDDAARELANAAQRSAQADPRIGLSQAMLALKQRDVLAADEHLARARTAWGARQPSAAWYHAAGLSAALANDLPRAAAVLEEGLAVHPHAAVLHNNLAVVQERGGSYELAARTIEHALLEDANCAHLHKNLGDYFYRAQRYDEAFDAFSRVLRLAPEHGADVLLKVGNIHYRRGALREAADAWQGALARDPENRIVMANLATLTATHASARPGTPPQGPHAHDDTMGDDALVGEAA